MQFIVSQMLCVAGKGIITLVRPVPAWQ